jgi:hypothetical protein
MKPDDIRPGLILRVISSHGLGASPATHSLRLYARQELLAHLVISQISLDDLVTLLQNRVTANSQLEGDYEEFVSIFRYVDIPVRMHHGRTGSGVNSRGHVQGTGYLRAWQA